MWLRQSTASQEILLGRFVDSTDGSTPETALTIANTDIKLWVEGATTLANKNSGGATHIATGLYYAVLDATDTATLGKMEIHVQVSGALPIKREFMVLPAVVYDALVLGSDNLDVNMVQLNGVAVGTSDGTAQAGAAGSITLASGASAVNSTYVDRTVTITGGTGAGQSRVISAYVGSTKVATVHRNWDTNPDNTSTYSIGESAVAASVFGSVGSLGTQAKADVNAEVDTALADYDAPTNAEMVARTLATAFYATATDQALIKAKTDLIPASPAAVGSTMTLDMTQAVPTSNTAQTVGDSLNGARAQAFGRWVKTGTSLVLYAGNGTTVVRTFTLDDADAPTSRT